jgi:hypothetical protein
MVVSHPLVPSLPRFSSESRLLYIRVGRDHAGRTKLVLQAVLIRTEGLAHAPVALPRLYFYFDTYLQPPVCVKG